MMKYYRGLAPIEKTAIISGLMGILIITGLWLFFSLGYHMKFVYQLTIGMIGMLIAFVVPSVLLYMRHQDVRTEIDPEVYAKDERLRNQAELTPLERFTAFFRRGEKEEAPVVKEEWAFGGDDETDYAAGQYAGRKVRGGLRRRPARHVDEDALNEQYDSYDEGDNR